MVSHGIDGKGWERKKREGETGIEGGILVVVIMRERDNVTV